MMKKIRIIYLLFILLFFAFSIYSTSLKYVIAVNEINLSVSVFIDPKVITELENQTWVSVSVLLRDNSNITLTGTKEERRNLSIQRDAWFRLELDKILTTFSENETRNVHKHITSLDVEITKQGFDRLANDTRIASIGLAYDVPGGIASQNESQLNNETNIENKIKEREIMWVGLSIIVILLIIILYLITRAKKK